MDMSTQGAQESNSAGPSHTAGRREEGEHNGNGYNSSAQRLARGLGWFSIGLGFAELFAPKAVARIAGLNEDTCLIQLMGYGKSPAVSQSSCRAIVRRRQCGPG